MDCLLVCFSYVHDLVAQYKLYTSIVVFNLKPNFDLMFSLTHLWGHFMSF